MARRPVHIPKTALTEKKRATLRASDFAVPSERKYPINDLFHARLALTYVLSPSNAAYRDEVVRAVMARYPELQFWWASRSRGVEAKRAKKATSRRASGRRMVANPRRNPALDWQTRPVGDGVEYVATAPNVQYVIWRYFPNSGYNIDRDYKNLRSFPLRGQTTLTAAKEEAERDLETLLRKNPHDEWMDEDELAREQERKARTALFRSLGPNVGSNADWADPAYDLKGGWFLVDSEDGTLDIVKRGRWNARDEFYEDETLARFDTAADAMRFVETLKQKSNPRREVETEAYFAAMEPTRAKYAGRSPEDLVLVRSRAAKLLRKFAGKSDREVAKALGLDSRDPAVLRQIATMREHAVVTNPAKRGAKRSGGRTAAQSNAAKAMRLFHSGKASSLAEAWAMLRR